MSKSNSTGVTGFAGFLTIVFIVLKLCKVITWSWLWVLSPVWICLGIALILIIIGLILINL
jgi:glucan phosphoethanolaminetransferase (alkaline phosphatase superfamily)